MVRAIDHENSGDNVELKENDSLGSSNVEIIGERSQSRKAWLAAHYKTFVLNSNVPQSPMSNAHASLLHP